MRHFHIFQAIVFSVLVGVMSMLSMGSADVRNSTTTEEVTQAQTGRYGPYATWRRANEVANHYRSYGFNASVYSQWEEYYVNVW